MERDTGLTFVQRARIRRALESGGVLDPPTFLQRFGPVPSWVGGLDPPGSSAFSASSGCQNPGAQASSGSAGSGPGRSRSALVDSSGFWTLVLGQSWAVWVRFWV